MQLSLISHFIVPIFYVDFVKPFDKCHSDSRFTCIYLKFLDSVGIQSVM